MTARTRVFKSNEVMTLAELYFLLPAFRITLTRPGRRGWVAKGWGHEAIAATPMDAVSGLLRKIGGANG